MNKFKSYRDTIDIDYYVYFTKAYFAFNAYLKAKNPTLNDCDKIKKMKNDRSVLQKFKELIDSGKHFRDDLIALKEKLSSAVIENNNEIITFDRVKIGDHKVVILFDKSYCGVPYIVRAIDNDMFMFTVNNVKSPSFTIENLEITLKNTEISKTQKDKIKALINEHVESYNINLSRDIERLKTIDKLDREQEDILISNLYKGFIEILYKLRNALFHSEVEPNSEVMKVYKYTYFILRKILHKIPT